MKEVRVRKFIQSYVKTAKKFTRQIIWERLYHKKFNPKDKSHYF
jgi:hypothetical protein